MSRTSIIAIITVSVVVSIVWVVVSSLNISPSGSTDTNSDSSDLFDMKDDSPFLDTGIGATSSMPIVRPGERVLLSGDGTGIVVQDFIGNGTTFQDPMNLSVYVVSGDIGYCAPQRGCLNNSISDQFSISFDIRTSTFTITILSKQIDVAILAAENHLMSTLGISRSGLCDVRYEMAVPQWVSEQYAGQRLLFNACGY